MKTAHSKTPSNLDTAQKSRQAIRPAKAGLRSDQLLKSSGVALDDATRSAMETRFEQDFSGVRVHSDGHAAETAATMNARAFTVGSNISFAQGLYAPHRSSGRELLAHELTHVVQQSGSRRNGALEVASANSLGEAEARGAERAITNETKPINVSQRIGVQIARAPASDAGEKILQTLDALQLELNRSPPLDELIEFIMQRLAGINMADGNNLEVARAKIDSLFGLEASSAFIDRAGMSHNNAASGDAANQSIGESKPSKEVTWTVKLEEAIVKNGGKNGGANLRTAPKPGAELVAWLPQNTRVQISRESSQKWIQVSVSDGDHKGKIGYMANWLVLRDFPDPKAIVHTIKAGEGLSKLVENHKHFAGHEIRTGDDARTLVMAVYSANKGMKGVRIDEEKLKKAQSSGGFLDFFDNYRATLRPIYQSVELVAGESIWLPGPGYIKSLKKTGVIPQRSGVKNALIATGKAAGGLVQGIAEGFAGGIADTISGIGDLIDAIGSILTGEAFSAAEEFVNAMREMSAEELMDFGEKVLAGLKKMVIGAIDDFTRSWNAASPFKRWNFRGRIVGFILAEVAVALVTGGVLTALKWAGRFAKIGGKISAILRRIGKTLNKTLSKARRKKRRSTQPKSPTKKSPHAKESPSADQPTTPSVKKIDDVKKPESPAPKKTVADVKQLETPTAKKKVDSDKKPDAPAAKKKVDSDKKPDAPAAKKKVDSDKTSDSSKKGDSDKKPDGSKKGDMDPLSTSKKRDVLGRRVYQNDEVFRRMDDDLLEKNIELMRKGNAPKGRDGNPMELHHMTQTEMPGMRKGVKGALIELTDTQHSAAAKHGLSSVKGRVKVKTKVSKDLSKARKSYDDLSESGKQARKTARSNRDTENQSFRKLREAMDSPIDHTDPVLKKQVQARRGKAAAEAYKKKTKGPSKGTGNKKVEVPGRKQVRTPAESSFDSYKRKYWIERAKYLQQLLDQRQGKK